ncbi:MAG: NAD-dependent succinate-semialdehyde dehydrogenase [candidate division NC10 bacterium]|nr:NAD-dependent succinate-semialdehyde dehydrogenase [candidate division NC10 bacterium]
MFIDGRWVEADAGRTFPVENPATGEIIAQVPWADREETRRAIEAAHRAFPAWANLPARDRAAILFKARDLMLEHREDLARLLALEEGKPIAEARGEILYSADFLGWFAEEGKRVYGEMIPASFPNKRLLVLKRPIGVAGIITIWNFPSAGITRPVAPALAAGCTVVVKPAEQTPLSAIAIFELLDEAGLPPGVANLVTAFEPEAIGREFLENPLVRKLNFTGSVEVGKLLMRGAADQVKRITLELGGHAPFIVFEDANLDAAAKGALLSKFRNAGQTCICINRIYVHEAVLEPFTQCFVELVKGLKMGNPLDESVQVGPLIDKQGFLKVKHHIQEALSKGAKLLCGGGRREDGEFAKGYYHEPTVFTQVTHEMRIMHEETFGPVVPIVPFKTEEEVLSFANAMPYGLAAFFFTRDLSRAIRFAERLEYGIVGVNDPFPGTVQAPFGGVKQSGLGREGGHFGLEEYLDVKFVSLGI